MSIGSLGGLSGFERPEGAGGELFRGDCGEDWPPVGTLAGESSRTYDACMRPSISAAFAVATFFTLAGCGGGPAAPPPGAGEPGPAVAAEAPAEASPAALDGRLAVALEGDVEHLGDTLYRAMGPDLRCAAVLLDSGGGEPVPATSLVEWKVTPSDAGTFSMGPRGAYFLPSRAETVTIHAELPGEGGGPGSRSPGLSLAVTSAAPPAASSLGAGEPQVPPVP